MASICKWITAAGLALLLMACGREDSETPSLTETGYAPDTPSAPLHVEPGSQPPPIDTDAETTGEPATADPARAERQRLREQRGQAGHWWDDPALIADMALTAEQRNSLAQAHQILHIARLDARSRLQDLRATETTEQHDRQEPGRLQRSAVEARLDEAHQNWQRAVREILHAEQLEQLFERHPEAMDRTPLDGQEQQGRLIRSDEVTHGGASEAPTPDPDVDDRSTAFTQHSLDDPGRALASSFSSVMIIREVD